MKKKLIIIGAGLTGMSAAARASEKFNVEVIEKNSYIGGISSTFKYKKYYLDYGPHKIYTQIPEVLEEIKKLIGKDLLKIKKKSKIRLKGKYFNYPVQIKELLLGISPVTALNCGISYIIAAVKKPLLRKKEETYEDYVINRFGKVTYDLVFKPLAQKYWGNPKELSKDLAITRISMPGMIQMLKLMLTGKKPDQSVSAEYFYYPKKGIIQITEKLAEKMKKNNGKLKLNADTTRINIENNKVKSVTYKERGKEKIEKADYVISTAPINKLPEMLNAPEEVKQAAKNLRYRNLILLYIIANKERIFEDNWRFFPEKKFPFTRLSEQKGFSSYMIPKNKTVLTAE
ncbi:unnamed protein product, partial [marine sediment metagenome]